MEILLIILIAEAVVFGVPSGVIWSNKGGRGGVGFLLGTIFGLIGLIMVAAMTPTTADRRGGR